MTKKEHDWVIQIEDVIFHNIDLVYVHDVHVTVGVGIAVTPQLSRAGSCGVVVSSIQAPIPTLLLVAGEGET